MQQLVGPLQRSLAKVLCQAAVGLLDTAAVNSYIPHLMQNVVGEAHLELLKYCRGQLHSSVTAVRNAVNTWTMPGCSPSKTGDGRCHCGRLPWHLPLTALHAWLAEEIKALAARPDLPSIAARPDVVLRADGLLSILRGAAGGCGPRSQPPLWALVRAVVGPLTVLAEAFHADATITCLLLKLAGDVVEAHISYLPVTLPCPPPPADGSVQRWWPQLQPGSRPGEACHGCPIPISLPHAEMAAGVT